jgi:polar amino acid transport system substrate-binding protein
MHRPVHIRFIVSLLLAISGKVAAENNLPADTQTEKVILVASDPWWPYAGVEGSDKKGYGVELIEAVMAPAGWKIRYINLAWNRCLEEFKTGHVTALIGLDRRESPGAYFPQHSINQSRPTYFTGLKSSWKFTGPDSLKQIRLGSVSGYTFDGAINEHIAKGAYTGAPGSVLIVSGDNPLSRMVRALEADRIDAFVDNYDVVHASLTPEEMARLRIAGVMPGVGLYIAFSPARPDGAELAREFDEGMERLQQSGKLREMLERYGLLKGPEEPAPAS